MSILIKGMEMPTRCGRCDMCVPEADGDIDWHNVCCITGADIVDVGEKMVDCPLVPVPKHGRLIDADAYKQELKDCRSAFWDEVLDSMPTIIPAEEGEK